MAFWYLGHDDELLIDLDDYTRPTKNGGPWGEIFFRRRLREAMGASKLDVIGVYLSRSASTGHFSAIVRLASPLPTIERLVWQLHCGSDLYRGRADLMRAARGIAAPSLLILPRRFSGLYREPDRICPCEGKHRTDEQHALGANACTVWRELRGMSPWELFGPSSATPEGWVPLPLGRVPLSLIREIRSRPGAARGARGASAAIPARPRSAVSDPVVREREPDA